MLGIQIGGRGKAWETERSVRLMSVSSLQRSSMNQEAKWRVDNGRRVAG